MSDLRTTETPDPNTSPGLDRASALAQIIVITLILAGAIFASRAGAQNVVPILGTLAGFLVPAAAKVVQTKKRRQLASSSNVLKEKQAEPGVRIWRVALIWAFAYLIGFATPRLIDIVATPSANLSLAARGVTGTETELTFSWNRIPPEKQVTVFVFSTASKRYFPQRFCGYSSETRGERQCIVDLGREHDTQVLAVMLDGIGVRDLEDRLQDPTFDGLPALPRQAIVLRATSLAHRDN